MNKICRIKPDQTGIQIVFPIVVFIVILGTAFCDFHIFTDSELSSKWYWLYTVLPLCGLLFLVVRQKQKITIGYSAYLLIFLFLYCFIRGAIGDFIVSFLSIAACFFLIFYLTGKAIRDQAFKWFSVSIVTVSFLQALYGIAQYTGLLHSNGNFKTVGSFDNSAGFASMLTLSVPFALYFISSKNRQIKNAALLISATICIAVILSGSRTGLLALLILSILYIINRHLTTKIAVWKKIVIGCLLIAILTGLYFTKKDSADGRVLIWKCTWEMIQEKPVFGHGYKSFMAKYMLYQAHYFEQNPESDFGSLADNIKHPFNEFLLLIVEFGIIAFLFLSLLIINLIRTYLKNKNEESFILILCLTAVFVFSCFSYPFQYPFTWFIVGFCISYLSVKVCNSPIQSHYRYRIVKNTVALLSIALLSFNIKNMYYDWKWHQAVNQIRHGTTKELLSEYESLYPHFYNNPFFLYNYAALLNSKRDWDNSAEIIRNCEKYLTDYDIQMLKGDNYKKQHYIIQAKECFEVASQMCPGKFTPLFELVNIYDSLNQPDRAKELAVEIINKPVKVPSATITAMKMRMTNRMKAE